MSIYTLGIDIGSTASKCVMLLDGKETTHHFMVTEVYAQQASSWKLCTFSFTALVY